MKKHQKARFSALFLALALAVTSMSGCQQGGTDDNSSASQDDGKKTFDATINILFPGDAPAGLDEVNQAVSEKMKEDGLGNFTFNYTFVPWDQYRNKRSMVRASEEDYDLMWHHSGEIPAAFPSHMLAPLDDALEKYGQHLLEYIPDYAFKQSTYEGKIYAIPRVVPSAQYDSVLSIRGDLRKKYNIPELKTLDDVETYFQTIKDNEPDMVPTVTVPFGEVFYRAYTPSWYISRDYGIAIDLEDPEYKVMSFYGTDEFAQMAEKSEEFRQKGFYYPDYDPKRVPENEFMAGKAAAAFGNVMWPTERIDTLTANIPGAEIETVFINPDVPKYMYSASDNLLAVFEHSQEVDACVAFIDWIHTSQENYDLYTYGIEGTNYNLEGESVSLKDIPQEKLYQPISWAWTDLRYNRYSAALDPDYVDVINHWDDDAVVTDLVGFAIDTDPIKTELTNYKTVYETYIKPVTEAGTATFDREKTISELKAAGMDKIVEEVQKQVDQYIAENAK